MPQRERFTLIINELGAAVAGRSEDLQTALQRAVPALTETDNLLNLLGNDSQTLEALTANSNAVVTALANNSTQVQNFIVEADKAATDTATQQANLKTSLQRFPGLLEQLKPTMAKLGTAATANTPVLTNLNAAASQLHTFFTNLAPCSLPHKGNQCGFANASLPALQSLGQASVTGQAGGRRPQRRRSRSSTSSLRPRARAARAPASSPRTWRSCSRTSTTRTARSSPTRGAPAARASAVWRRCSSTRSTSPWRSTSSGRTGTCSRSTRSSTRCARRTHRRGPWPRTSSSTAPPTASATRGSGPTSPASTRPIRPIRARACPIRAARLRDTPARRPTRASARRRR